MSKIHLKTGGLGALRPVFVPSLAVEEDSPESSLLCSVVALRHYLSRSRSYRSPTQKNLFISWVPGQLSDIRLQTLSKYIKQAVLLAYKEADSSLIETLKIKPHSVRHVSTSLIALKHFSIDDVLRTGSWASPNVFISHYLQNFSSDVLTGLNSVESVVACGVVI